MVYLKEGSGHVVGGISGYIERQLLIILNNLK
jgi:hypothetical protein